MPRYQLNEQMKVKYSNRLDNEIISKVQIGPVQDRKCTDIVCLIIFILFLITFVGFLAYFLISGSSSIKQLSNNYDVEHSQSSLGSTFAKSVGAIIGMIVLSCVLSVIFIILCAKFPKCVVISGIIVTFLCYLAIIVIAFILKQFLLAFIVLAVAVINGLMLYCWRQQIKVGIALLQASGTFMIQKPSIAAIGLISLILNVIFLVLYILGWLSAYTQTLPSINSSESSRDRFSSMMIFFIFMGIYLGYFLYYLMVFVLSTAVAYWYYQEDKHILHGYKSVRKHVGSLALASIIITIIVILRRAAQKQFQDTQNTCLKIVWCFVACIMRCIEGFVEVLNHNSIIVMSITGQNYINSAKTAIGLIFNNYPLFWIVDFISDFIQFYSLVLCILIPSIIGGGIIWETYKVGGTAVAGGIIIFLLSWIVTSVILGILNEALSAVFILFCFDKKLRSRGITNGRMPDQIKHLFNDFQSNQTFTIVHMQQAKPQTETNFAKEYQNNNIHLDGQNNTVNKETGRKARKRKVSRKKIGQKSQDNKSGVQDQVSGEIDNNYNYGASNYPIGRNDEKSNRKGNNQNGNDMSPYYYRDA